VHEHIERDPRPRAPVEIIGPGRGWTVVAAHDQDIEVARARDLPASGRAEEQHLLRVVVDDARDDLPQLGLGPVPPA